MRNDLPYFFSMFPHLFFTHLDSRRHSSQPAKQSKNSTEGWNEFFHFSAESYSNTSSKPCETGACALTQRWSPLTAGRAQACVAISIKAAAPATAPWPAPLQLEIKEKNSKHANIRNRHRGGIRTNFITGFLLSLSDCNWNYFNTERLLG